MMDLVFIILQPFLKIISVDEYLIDLNYKMFKSLKRPFSPYLSNQLSWNFYSYSNFLIFNFDYDMSKCSKQLSPKYIIEENGSSHLKNIIFYHTPPKKS